MPSRLEELKEELKEAEGEFDPYYQYTEDFRVWSKHQAIKERIQKLKSQIKEIENAEAEN